jgi:hypothetical protein
MEIKLEDFVKAQGISKTDMDRFGLTDHTIAIDSSGNARNNNIRNTTKLMKQQYREFQKDPRRI